MQLYGCFIDLFYYITTCIHKAAIVFSIILPLQYFHHNKRITNMLIQPYHTEWSLQFERIQLELTATLQGLDHTIEHVGSTAVPGLAAKAIIDIDIVYPPKTAFEAIRSQLLGIGYYHNGGQGIAEREVFKRHGTDNHNILDGIVHHLYVCPAHSKELERHIRLRDCLRNNETARLQYQAIKYELAAEANQDKKQYAALKQIKANPFINTLIGFVEEDRCFLY
jgi:GrpB-like predicted nucleotidyltransferase (UPF0157 family)